ncbi:MAG TPA: ABC transporter substrate-binding protein, partial [Gammaproteobacteria bacterium]|nr:ABC transporter substrate-binding protein [Gammaproteobacteria bacterium]
MTRFALLWLFSVASFLTGCSDEPWNNPYPDSQSLQNIYYDVFEERPKHLDPVTSYSANEYVFLGQIYEPPLQYHFLKRPYELTPLTATAMPEVEYYNESGDLLDGDPSSDEIARVVYRIHIRPGILFQPHPAFAKDASGRYLYHELDREDMEAMNELSDFSDKGTRELTAEDYVYQVKRFAHPGLHSPIGGLMGKYIIGLRELEEKLRSEYVHANRHTYIDLRQYELPGVRVLDRYTFEIVLGEKYPQFIFWLAMPFFAPMPWEADRFYTRPGMQEKNIVLDWYPVGTGPYML